MLVLEKAQFHTLMVKKMESIKVGIKIKLKSEGFYSGDLMDGDWKFYYANGNIMADGSFLNGNGK